MTYKELCAEIAALGFESEIDSADRVIPAVNRTLMTLFTERPSYGSFSVYKPALLPSVSFGKIEHKGGGCDTVTYDTARAYSFRTFGKGSFAVRENGKELTVAFSKSGEIHRGFVHGVGEIAFLGEFSYTVTDFMLFDIIYSDSPEDIPIASSYTEYRIADIVNDFLAPAFCPKDESGNDIKGAEIRDGRLFLPKEFVGEATIYYKKAPQRISGNPDEAITLPIGCEHLVALLAASYIWLDDDAEKAYYYMNLYKEAMASLRYHNRTHAENTYGDVDGWA